jgi:hypothetical protein
MAPLEAPNEEPSPHSRALRQTLTTSLQRRGEITDRVQLGSLSRVLLGCPVQ